MESTGLAETLRSELALYHIDVQLFQACTMYTPGFENENKTKPPITKKIEEGDEGLTPEVAAARMLKGTLLPLLLPPPPQCCGIVDKNGSTRFRHTPSS